MKHKRAYKLRVCSIIPRVLGLSFWNWLACCSVDVPLLLCHATSKTCSLSMWGSVMFLNKIVRLHQETQQNRERNTHWKPYNMPDPAAWVCVGVSVCMCNKVWKRERVLQISLGPFAGRHLWSTSTSSQVCSRSGYTCLSGSLFRI